jgi:hypothetical protein
VKEHRWIGFVGREPLQRGESGAYFQFAVLFGHIGALSLPRAGSA